ncbi:restriction endonuclease [Bradyrhizobium diazoefficiens]|uniref:restriction endonuclease n=1 Tax=Bradyrhizobium diazoefficiens TaxID=1355477 RepID=UPI001B509D19|nr:restriction system protein [Bradyrhizobium japonicum]
MAEERPIWGIHMNRRFGARPIDNGFIAIGWLSVGDLSQLSPKRESYKKAVAAVYPNIKPGAVPVVAGTLFKFVHEMKKGDLIIYPSKEDRMINLGIVEGDYQFLPDADEMQCPNRRRVRWTHQIARPTFSQGALHEIGSAVTLFSVRNNAEEFMAAFDGKPLPSEDVDAETGTAAAAFAEEEVEDFVLKRLKSGLSFRQFEYFVAHLLERMGYHCRVTQATGDGGIDIIAHKDELGFKDVIKVQCKQTLNTIGQPQVAQLYGHIQDNENGLFVTLGSYSTPALEFERANQNIRLMTGDEMIKLIFDYYEEFEPRYRMLLPLKRTYVVATDDDGLSE